jgi:DNA-binding IclR family transcriptional regulator
LEDQKAYALTSLIAEKLGLPTKTVRRALEDLAAHGLAIRHGQGQGNADLWESTDA